MKDIRILCLSLTVLLLSIHPHPACAAETISWDTAYKEFILDGNYLSQEDPAFYTETQELIRFGLYDLDKDGFPELIAYNGCEYMAGAANYVYTCKDGQVSYIGDAGFRGSVLQYYPTSDFPGLFCSDGNNGIIVTVYYEYKNGQFVQETVMEEDYNTMSTDGEPQIKQVTENTDLYTVPLTQSPVTLDMFTVAEIRDMGWENLLARYPFVRSGASGTSAVPEPASAAAGKAWEGTWTNSTGDCITVTAVTDSSVTLEYSGYAARNTADGKLYFTLPFLDDARTSVGESEEVLQQDGFRTVFTLADGHLSMYYNDHMYIFDRTGTKAAGGATSGGDVCISPFYGIWCGASKSEADMQAMADTLIQHGFDAHVLVTTDWDNLNPERWYVVTAGLYASEDTANAALSSVRSLYPDAYVKYSGNHKGSATAGTVSASVHEPFYGIWCSASKSYDDLQSEANALTGQGLPAQIFVTTDWSNLNPEFWYVLSAGTYASEEAAYSSLPLVQAVRPDAYVKYSGEYIGK